MRKHLSILGLILMLIIVCDKESLSENSNNPLSGKYSGIFQRGEETGNVTLEFQNMKFSGQSEIIKFPAICEGNYSIKNDSINFENICRWTAEFDWTLILNDNWKYEISKEKLILTKTNGDRYILTRE